ncbi:hypothetical protein DVS77_23385 [Mycolicibacterium moriokaense]|nr:hypothetical protein DVS77_23385 [Mycolicibacterium moriokaense]
MASMVKKAAAGAFLGGSLLFTGGMGMASAAPLQLQDGLVNLAVGDVTILQDVNVGVAATAAAAICDVADIGSVNVLAEAVDSGNGPSDPVCNVPGGDVTLTQNAGTPGNSGGAGNSENSNAGGNGNAR